MPFKLKSYGDYANCWSVTVTFKTSLDNRPTSQRSFCWPNGAHDRLFSCIGRNTASATSRLA